jgi:hypothetical protein
MLSLIPASPRRGPISRRALLRMGSLALGGLSLPSILQAEDAVSQAGNPRRATAKNCIYLFLCGGPSQPDLWDLKPDAPSGIRSVFDPIETNVPGIRFGSLIPGLARHADSLCLIRSMTHDDNDHVGAIVRTLLGQPAPRPGDFYISRSDHPGLGALLHHRLGDCEGLPSWVVLPRYFETGSPPYKGQSAGFLGGSSDPVAFDKQRKGSLSDAPLRIDSLRLPDEVSAGRFDARSALLRRLGDAGQGRALSPPERQLEDYRAKAVSLISAGAAQGAFDLEAEPDAVRDRYGRNEYGQSLLMARRLVEAGVRMVNVFWTFFDDNGCQFNLWDNHGVASDVCGVDGQFKGVDMLRHDYCCPSFDRALPALLDDLKRSGLLDETLVVVAGEFGRTPKINATSGRDHWAHCYTQLLAGGGVQGGQVYGASDATGAYVRDHPVSPDDFAATILHAFGLSPDDTVPDPTGRPVRISQGTPVTAIF